MMDTIPEPRGPAAESIPLFVNVTEMDREKYFEAVRARLRYPRSRLLRGAGILTAVAGLLMGSRPAAGLGMLIAALSILSPLLIGARDFRRLLELHPEGTWTKTLRFYPDRLESDSGSGRVTVISYDRIRREAETEHMYILEFGRDHPATAFEKGGFVRGSAEGFRPFLTEARRRGCGSAAEEIG